MKNCSLQNLRVLSRVNHIASSRKTTSATNTLTLTALINRDRSGLLRFPQSESAQSHSVEANSGWSGARVVGRRRRRLATSLGDDACCDHHDDDAASACPACRRDRRRRPSASPTNRRRRQLRTTTTHDRRPVCGFVIDTHTRRKDKKKTDSPPLSQNFVTKMNTKEKTIF